MTCSISTDVIMIVASIPSILLGYGMFMLVEKVYTARFLPFGEEGKHRQSNALAVILGVIVYAVAMTYALEAMRDLFC